jgi:hypothetical protein
VSGLVIINGRPTADSIATIENCHPAVTDTPRRAKRTPYRGDAQLYPTSNYRPATFEVISKDQRSEWFEQQDALTAWFEKQGILQQVIPINDPRYLDLLDERSLYFRPFLLKWSDVGPGQVNESRWELLGAELKHIYASA